MDVLNDFSRFGPEVASVADDPAFAELLVRADEAKLSVNMNWFFSQHDRILANGYTPAPEDLLRTRVRTTGVAHCQANKITPRGPLSGRNASLTAPVTAVLLFLLCSYQSTAGPSKFSTWAACAPSEPNGPHSIPATA